MTTSDQLESWREIFARRDIDIDEIDPPANADGTWFEAITCYARRGFLRVLISPTADAMAFEAQFAIPGADDGYRRTLNQHLSTQSGSTWEMASSDGRWTLASKAVPQENMARVVDIFERVAEHVGRIEDGADIDALAGSFADSDGDSTTASESTSTKTTAESTIGSTRNVTDDSDDKATKDVAATPFESIGGSDADASDAEASDADALDADASDAGESESSEPAPSDDPATASADRQSTAATLDTFNIRVDGDQIVVELTLADPVDAATKNNLSSDLARTLPARFDIDVVGRQLDERGGQPLIRIFVESSGVGAIDAQPGGLGDVAEQIGQYLGRLKKFGQMGMSLTDVLVPASATPAGTSVSSAASSPDTSSANPTSPDTSSSNKPASTKPDRSRQAAPSSRPVGRAGSADTSDASDGGVVFSFDDPADPSPPAPSGAGPLEAGNFGDPRIRRDDATTSLVDVVLRHPGYSDTSMRQVLSILLDIDYYESSQLAEQAPCVIAWSVSQERAHQFKRVITEAGGRVTLVEPDSLA